MKIALVFKRIGNNSSFSFGDTKNDIFWLQKNALRNIDTSFFFHTYQEKSNAIASGKLKARKKFNQMH